MVDKNVPLHYTRRAMRSAETWRTILTWLGFFLLLHQRLTSLCFSFLFSAGKSWVSQPFLPVFPWLLFCPFVCTFCSADFSFSAAYLWLHFHRRRSGLTGQPLWTPPSLPPRQGLTFLLGVWGSGSPRALEKLGGQATTAPPTAWAAGTH